ncbi:MAG: hypothetical protein K1X94_27550 [Sandaracinaceae bacterium]|nr:hypothetical protein [Sandaracinaceae bacterium]
MAVEVALATPLAGCESLPCDAGALTSALGAAGSGDVVEIGACRIAGAFEVPAGVTVRGMSGTVLASVDARPVLTALGPASVSRLEIDVDHGGVGVVARTGALTLTNLDLVVTRGVGVGVEGVPLTASLVRLRGPITEANAAFAPMAAAETGTFGLVARGLASGQTVTLTDVHVADFAVAGVSVGGGTLTWSGPTIPTDVEGIRGVGIALFGTHASLEGVEVASMRSGVGMPGIGVVASPLEGAATELAATELVVRDGDGYGLFGDGAAIVLDGAELRDLGLMGVRLQGGSLEATDLAALRNGGAGVMAIDTDHVGIERGQLDAQREALFVTSLGSVRVADGLEMVRDPDSADAPPLDLTLIDVSLGDNARAGLLLDANDASVGGLRIENVTASASGSGYGAVTQRTPVPDGWDTGIARMGAAATNDAAFSTPIDVVGIMMPPGLVATPPPF